MLTWLLRQWEIFLNTSLFFRGALLLDFFVLVLPTFAFGFFLIPGHQPSHTTAMDEELVPYHQRQKVQEERVETRETRQINYGNNHGCGIETVRLLHFGP
jgi:hypothetical protein